jgi:hypothetical protein
MRSTLLAAVLFIVAGCATGIAADAYRPMPLGERADLAPQAGGGGGM